MKTLMITSIVLLAGVSGEAMAACSGAQVVNGGTAITENAVITFKALATNETTTVAGVTYTPKSNGNTPASTVAAQFQDKSYTGWTSGTRSGDTVTFTSTTTNTNVANITYSTTGSTALGVTITQGNSGNALTDLLTGNTVCVGSSPTWDAQEYHQAGGALIDWKRGSGHPVDPTSQVGTWSITGTGTETRVNYHYGTTTYSNKVWSNGGNSYSFCNPNETVGTIKSGQGACP